ncbi:MAG: oligosaccharide flippase family protein [Acetobacteraceae bacterium]|nr:oligosaccharide flippase family protein [Acetobacteraceae bacterium]
MTGPHSDTPSPLPSPSSLTRRVAAGTGWVIAWRVATRNIGLISTLVLVRLLAPSDFGLVALATSLASAIDALSGIGVHDALIRERAPTKQMYDSAFTMNLIRGFATAFALAVAAWPIAEFFAEPRLLPVVLALAGGMAIGTFENIGTVDFRREMAFQKEFRLQIGSRLFGTAITLGLAFVWQSHWALVAGILSGRTARVVQSYALSAYRARLDLSAWRSLIGFSFWSWAQTIVGQVRARSDSIIVGRMLGAAPVAAFSVGQELGELPITELVAPLHRALFSGFALLQQTGESPALLYRRVVEVGFVLLLPAGIGISMVADPLIRLVLDSRWLGVTPVVQIIAAASTVSIFSTVADAMFSAAGRLRMTFVLMTVVAVLRVPMLVVLVWLYGITGAALAYALASLMDQGLYLWRALPSLQIRVLDLLSGIWRPIAACIVMVGGLQAAGLAWTEARDAHPLGLLQDLAERSGLGALLFAASLAAIWLASGRPDGAERNLMDLLRVGGIQFRKLAVACSWRSRQRSLG